jgi:hypothetical protein
MNILLALLIGAVVGVIDILPMIKMKVDKYSTWSAFFYYLILPLIIFNTDMLSNIWWLKGGIIAILLAIPIIILVAKEDKKSPIAMTIMSIVLGSVIGIIGHFSNLM